MGHAAERSSRSSPGSSRRSRSRSTSSNFGSYDKTYGTLGGVVVFLIWLWVTNIAILLGAEFNAETERAKQMHTGVQGAEETLQLPASESREQSRGRRTMPERTRLARFVATRSLN